MRISQYIVGVAYIATILMRISTDVSFRATRLRMLEVAEEEFTFILMVTPILSRTALSLETEQAMAAGFIF